MPPIVVVTDSTSSLPVEVTRAHGIEVVPLQVVIGSQVFDEGSEGATPERVAQALRDFVPVSTSRPAPTMMLEVYERLAAEGATGIVSVHISGEMSGTFESAQLAARQASVEVRTVDTRQVGAATGYAALSAAAVAAGGGSVAEAAEAASARAARSRSFFYVDTLEYLRRGGRIGSASAFLGGALAVKPLLEIQEGRVATLERVRTASRAIGRLEDLVVAAAGTQPVDLCVAHLANPERAAELSQRLRGRLAGNLEDRDVYCTELGAVLGAHVGPGMLAAVVSPRD